MTPMRILHLSSGDHLQSGMHTALLQVVSLIRHSGFSQAMVCGNPVAANTTKDLMDQTLVGTFYAPILDCRSYVRFQLFLRSFQPDLIQVWSNKIARFLWPKPTCPVVTYLGSHPDRRRAHRLRATSHAFIVPSQDMETDLRYKGFVHHPVHVIRHYVETKGPLPYPRGEFLGGNAPLIAAGGRLVQDKGFDILLQVCSKLKSPFHLIISGTGPEEGTLKAMAVSLGLEHKVTFLGWRDDFQRLLATADIVAMPSRYEPFGLVLLEAMAQKSAVIVSDVSGPKSILAKSDGAAIMLPLEDREGWIFQLERLLKNINDRKSLSETGYNYVLHHYGAEATRVRLMDFYQSLL